MTPEWQKKFVAGKSNRATKPDSMVHIGGSRSSGHHKKKMEMELKRPVSYNEVHIKFHKKKDGDYVSNRAKDFIESYETAMSEKYGEDSSTHPAVDSEIWLQAAGPSVHPTPMTNEDVTTAVNAALTSFMETQISQMQAQMQFFRTEILLVLKNTDATFSSTTWRESRE
ncbi:putative transposase, Ptta/En/Spm, plant [Sesbania bispinosa]|nr:putative transposase, Ptta/En/Spm, plant [Sesbania bispinosa]